MSQITLWTNSNQLSTSVALGDGRTTTIYIMPNEAYFDEDGFVQLFSMKFNDGVIGNFKLLPNNQTADMALRLIGNHLASWGLSIISGQIIDEDENTYVDNVARYLFEKAGGLVIENIFERYSIANSAYYEITSGELVFAKPVRLQLR